MRVLVDARLGWGSGIGRYIANTVPIVARLRPDIDFVAQVTPADEAQAASAFSGAANLTLRTVSIEPFSIGEQASLSSLSKGFDLTWFTNYWVPLNFTGRYCATVHDLLHLRADIFPASPVKRALAVQTFRKLARSASALSFGSRFSQREFEARFGAPRASAVHYYGIDHEDWPLFDPENPPRKSRRLLAVGATKLHKNFDILLEAWNQARVDPDWTLTIISPDAKLRSSIDLQGVAEGSGRVDIRQGVSNEELRRLYADTRIMLTPSLYEGFGLPFMEGMQAGAFCVTSTAESMVEIGEGAFAYFVNPRDLPGWIKAIEQSCRMFDQDGFDYSALQRHNMRHAAQFSWARVADTTAGLLGGLV